MSLELFPQNVTVLPGVRQLFKARANDLTPMWANVELTNLTKGVVDPDFSVRRVGLANSVFAEGALQLVGGLGAVEFTITPRCKPNNAGAFGSRFRFFFQGDTVQDYYLFLLSATISIEHSGGLLDTLNHVTAVGDKFRIELSNGFRLFINGVLRHERITGFTGTIKYPATYDVLVREFVEELPSTIPAPILEGDWQLRPVVTFNTPTHGSLSSPGPAIQTEYFNGTIPGKYRLEARIEPGMDIWFENGPPAGATVNIGGGGIWNWQSLNPFPSAAPGSGPNALSGPNAAGGPALTGQHEYFANNATQTLQINPGDVLSFWVWLDPVNTPQEIFIQWGATDSTGFNHRAFWGADLINIGTLGTPGKRFMGALPPTNQWVRLEIPASLIDLEGRVVNAISLNFWDSKGGFDQVAKIPRTLQRAEALITIPPLEIVGPLEITVEPESVTRLQTNYDVGPGVSWSKISGEGSVSGALFTADDEPGTTVVRATAADGAQIADMTIIVPAVITSAVASNLQAAGPGEEVQFLTNIASPTWSASAGSINSSSGLWQAPASTSTDVPVKITASDGAFSVTVEVFVLPVFPLDNPSTPITADLNKTVLISESEDRSSYIARVKDKDGLSYLAQEVQFLNCELDELEAVIAFWEANFPGKPFILRDNSRPAKPRIVCRFDSALRWQIESSCAVNISFRVKEAAL